VAPSNGLIAPAAAAAASEMRLKKKASVKLNESDRPKLTNKGQVTRQSPGNGSSTGGTEEEAKGLLGGSDEAFDIRPRLKKAAQC
jgi:hypothetical protein